MMPFLDYQPKVRHQRSGTNVLVFWLVFAGAAFLGLLTVQQIDELLQRLRGGFSDGTVALQTTTGVFFAAVVMAVARMALGKSLGLLAALGWGFLAAPMILVLFIVRNWLQG